MLPFFTDPYGGELIYSAIARYHFYSGNIDFKDTIEELFHSRSVIPSVVIGSRFSVLCENIGSIYSVERILANHTIYPYYAPFLSKERQNDIQTDVEGKGSGLYGRLGMVAGGICKKEGLYYCPKCATKDIERYGEPYIHREHQLQGIDYCANHELLLKRYSVDLSMQSRSEYIRFDKKILDLSITEDKDNINFKRIQIKLAKMADQLFQISHNKYSREDINLKYKALFREHGFLTMDGRVRINDVNKHFQSKFPEGFLEKFESTLDIMDKYNWLQLIARDTKRHVHPFRHLLMLYFLDQDVESFIQVEPDKGPFGVGPWPCLNKAASHYGENIINDVKIKRSYRSKNPIGEFSCSCGFVYLREGPDVKAINRNCIRHVKEYGDTWNEMLFKLESEGVKTKEIAEKLGVHPSTVRRYLSKIDGKKEVDSKDTKNNLINQCRTEIKNVIEVQPNYDRTQLLEKHRKIYRFLLKNDKEWLNNNLPAKRKKINKQIVDWEKRDQEYYQSIKELYNELLILEKPVRITPSLIGRRLKIKSHITRQGNLIKLPLTHELLSEIIESVQDFQYRRCCKIIEQMIEENKPIHMSTIRVLGGLSPDYYNEIKSKLEDYIHKKSLKNNGI